MGMADAELRRLKDGRFARWRLQPAANDIRFWALWPETNGVVWIGTLGAGLLRFQDGQFTRYTTEAGLPNDNVSQILGDHRGQLWLGTSRGVWRVARSDLSAVAEGTGRVLQELQFLKRVSSNSK